MDIEIKITKLPCGQDDCEFWYQLPGILEPAEIQRAALEDGWSIAEIDGQKVMICAVCKAEKAKGC